jgi:FkbM family methyltransferase
VNFPGALTALFEKAGMRGAPTILSRLSRFKRLERRVATVSLPGGQRISFPAYDPYWCRYLYAGKPYEPDVERIFHALGKGRTFIDCGANIGYWSVRHKEFGFTDAIAIEANPRLIPFLKKNYTGTVHHRAVSARSGESVVFSGDGAIGHISRNGEAGIAVPTLALRDLDPDGPALVKLDIEGAEIAAIEGLGDLDCILVYEDFPRQGMKVTRHLLDNDWRIFDDRMNPVTSADQVSADLGRGVPRNLVAMRPT